MRQRVVLLFVGAFFFWPLLVAAQNVAFVVDNSLGEVKIIDLAQRRVSATIPTGAESSEMLILPNNQRAFVTNPGENSVAVLDLRNNTRLATIAAGTGPGSLIASPDNRFVYVANDGSNDVSIIDTATLSVTATIAVGATPVQVNLSPNGRFLYVVNRDEEPVGTVSVIDTARLSAVQEIPVGLQPVQFAISPNLTTAYVVNSGSNDISVVELSRNEVTATIGVGQGPSGVAFSNDGRFLYVINRNSNNLSVVDRQQNAVIAQIPVGAQPIDMVVTFDSRFGYVSNRESNSVTVLDLTTRIAEATLQTGSAPFDLFLDPNEDFLYVTNLNSQSVTVIDVNTDRVVATIPVGGVPIQFTQWNAPTLLELASNPAPAGSSIILNGEGFLPASTVRFRTTAPPRTVTAPATWLDSQGLQVTIPAFQGSSAIVSMAHADGNSSEELTLRIGSVSPDIFSGGVVEGAGFQRTPYPISGGSIVSVFGSFPGIATEGAVSFPLPTALGNARVTFNGVPAPLLYAAPGQINLVAPLRLLRLAGARVAVSVGDQTSAIEAAAVAPLAPGLFLINTAGDGAFLHGERLSSRVTPSDPARRGEILVLFLTGMGGTTPSAIDGEPTPILLPPGDVLFTTTASPTVLVEGTPARVLFSGLAPGFSGLYQINFEVPSSAPTGNQVAVVVTAGERTSNRVLLAVQ